MTVQQLVDYINQERIQGKGDYQIKTALLSAGWAERDIDEALGRSPAQAAPMSNTNVTKFELARIFSLAWNTYKSNFKILFPLTLLLYLPIDVLDYLTQSGIGNTVYAFVWIFVQAFSFAAYKARVAAVPVTVKTVLAGEHIDLKSKTGPLIWTWFIGSLLNLLLFLLLIIPGVIYLVYWSLSTFVVLDKGLSGKKALNYSKDLVKGHWWQVFSVIVLTALMVVISVTPALFLPEGLIVTLLTSVLSSLPVLYAAHVLMFVYLNLEDAFARRQT